MVVIEFKLYGKPKSHGLDWIYEKFGAKQAIYYYPIGCMHKPLLRSWFYIFNYPKTKGSMIFYYIPRVGMKGTISP